MIRVVTSRARTNHDIALPKLNSSANAALVRLPTATTYVGATTYAFGWGNTCWATCDLSEPLRRATQLVLNTNDVDAYGGRAILTSAGNGAVCHGDSGGPLVKLVNGVRYQVGVTISSSASEAARS